MRQWTGSTLVQIIPCRLVRPLKHRNKRQWNLNRNTTICIHENNYENAVAKCRPFCFGSNVSKWFTQHLRYIPKMLPIVRSVCVSRFCIGDVYPWPEINFWIMFICAYWFLYVSRDVFFRQRPPVAHPSIHIHIYIYIWIYKSVCVCVNLVMIRTRECATSLPNISVCTCFLYNSIFYKSLARLWFTACSC